MAGLWEITSHSVAETEPTLSNHLFDSALVLVGAGHFTGAQAKTVLENQLGRSFTQAELDDANAIIAALEAKPTTTAKLIYMEEIKAAGIAAEAGVINETQWRTVLGI